MPPKADPDAFMAALEHPLRADIDFVRGVIRQAVPAAEEGIKWNAPSFRLEDDFATFHLRPTDSVCVILHTGAKKRSEPLNMAIDDPSGLLEWLAKDRCMARLGAGEAVRSKRKPFEALLKAWVSRLTDLA